MPGPRVQPHIHRLSHSSFRASSAQCERAAEPWPIRPDYPHPSSPFTSRRGRPGFSHRRAFRSASYLLASGPGAGDRPAAAPRARTHCAQASARPQHPPRLGACALPTTSPPPIPRLARLGQAEAIARSGKGDTPACHPGRSELEWEQAKDVQAPALGYYSPSAIALGSWSAVGDRIHSRVSIIKNPPEALSGRSRFPSSARLAFGSETPFLYSWVLDFYSHPPTA